MKKQLLKTALALLTFVCITFNMNAQIAGDFRSAPAANGNWSNTLSWQMYNGSTWVTATWLPGDSASVNVTIQDGTTIHLKKTPAKTIASLTVGEGASGILDFDSINGNITVTGATVISSSGQINFSTTGSRTFTDLTINTSGTWSNVSSNITIEGNLTNNGAFTSGTGTYSLTGAAKTIGGPITISTLSISGSYTNSNALTITASLAGGGTLTNATSAVLNLSGSASITYLNCTSNIPNEVIYNGTVAQDANATTYYNVLITNLTGTVSINAATTVMDTITISSGALLDIANSLAITGAIVNNGTITATGAASTIIFQGADPQTLTSQLTSNQIGNLTVNNPAGVTITPGVQINRGITLTSGNLSSGGTITLGSGSTNPFTYIRANGNIATTFITNYGTGINNFTYSGTTAAQTTGTELPATANSLTINNALGVTLIAAVSVTTLNLTAGILTATPYLVSVTGTAVANVTGGSSTAYVNGALSRAFPASVAAGVDYTFPVGKSAYQLFELINPVLNASGTITVQSYDASGGGTAGFGIATLNTNRYWTATPTPSTFITTAAVRLTEATPGSANTIGQSATINGIYMNIGATFAGQTALSNVVAPSLGSFVLATGGTLSPGIYPVGSSSTLTKLSTVAGILNTVTLTGDVIFEMQADYNGTTGELFPIIFNKINTGGGNWTATIRPALAVTTRTTSGDPGSGNTLIEFNGADHIAFDGRAGGTGNTVDWIFRNTRVAATFGPTFSFINGALNDELNYLQIEGQNTTAASGTILFGTSTGTSGNDSNTVSNCILRDRSDVTGTPANAICSNGTAGFENNTITVANNSIFNFNTYGIYAAVTGSAGGGGNWIITGNSFYSNNGPASQQTAINLAQGLFPNNGNNVISANYIGGSAPLCGGNAWSNYGSFPFNGISLTVDTGVVSSVQNNVIQNINLEAAASSFTGIAVINGSVNIGNITGNLVGSDTVSNSIQVAGTGNTIGIYSSPATATAVDTIENNVIANIYSSGISASQSISGIYADDGINTIINNSIFNLTAANGNAGTGSAASVNGISDISATTGQTISQNVIYSLMNTHVSAAVHIVGINYSGSITSPNVVSRNFIHNFSTTSSSALSMQTGINALAGHTTYSNNMIALGIDSNGNSQTVAPVIVGIDKASSSNMNFYYNSVYIGGSGVITDTSNTFAFRRTVSPTSLDSVVDNVFMNARSNATTGGKQYAIFLNSATRLVSDYNVLYTTGTGGLLGNAADSNYAGLSAWQSANALDAHSIAGNPAYINPAGTSSATDLDINPNVPSAVAANGIPINSITIDIHGDVRNAMHPDIGADEGNFTVLGLQSQSPLTGLQFTVYPNPAKDKLTVYGLRLAQSSPSSGGSTVTRIDIYNALGQVCQQSEITPLINQINQRSEIAIDVSALSPGVYFIQIADASTVQTVRFVKE